MTVHEIKTYPINELSLNAQQAAYQGWIETFEYPWHRENEDVIRFFQEVFNNEIDLTSWEYGYGYSFSLSYAEGWECDYQQWEPTQARLMAFVCNNYLPYFLEGKTISTGMVGKDYRSRKSNCTKELNYCPTGYCSSCEAVQYISDIASGKVTARDFDDFVRTVFDSLFSTFAADFESCLSFEYFVEEAAANDWEFTEEGNWF